MSRTKVSIPILQVILGFLQPCHNVLTLQVDLNAMEIISKNFPNKNWDIIDTKNESLLCSKTNLKSHKKWEIIDTKNESLLCSKTNIKSHSLKSSLTSYTQYTLFLTFRLIWVSWKWSQMISHVKKHWVWRQNQVCSLFNAQVSISPLEVVLGLIQPLHPVLGPHDNLWLLKMSQMSNPHKPGVWHQNQVSRIFRSKVMK